MDTQSSRPPAKKRLLVLSSTYPRWSGDHEPGFVHELSKRMAKDFEVLVLCPHAQGAKCEEVFDSVKVVRYRYAPSGLESLAYSGGLVSNIRSNRIKVLLLPLFIMAQFFAIWRLVRKHNIDVIHAHWLLPQGVIVAVLSVILRRFPPFLLTSHGSDLMAFNGRFFDGLKRWVINRSASYTVVSSMLKAKAISLGVDDDKVDIVPMGVDLTGKFTSACSGPRRGREMLFVGRLVKGKGVDEVLSILPKVLAVFPDALLTIVGSGPEEQVLAKQVRALGVADHVAFKGALSPDKISNFYRRAQVFVAPFHPAEGLGLVTIEALGCGCPVVTTDIPATREVLEGVKGVVTVPPHDQEALLGAVLKVLGDPCWYSEQVADSAKGMHDRFDWSEIAAKYSELARLAVRV